MINPTASPSPSVPAHEIRVSMACDTGQLIDALAAVWQCSYRDVLAAAWSKRRAARPPIRACCGSYWTAAIKDAAGRCTAS